MPVSVSKKKEPLDIEPILLDKQQDSSGFVATVLSTGQIIYQN
jgi:hypothetical protein